jgi:hypothetical protein
MDKAELLDLIAKDEDVRAAIRKATDTDGETLRQGLRDGLQRAKLTLKSDLAG